MIPNSAEFSAEKFGAFLRKERAEKRTRLRRDILSSVLRLALVPYALIVGSISDHSWDMEAAKPPVVVIAGGVGGITGLPSESGILLQQIGFDVEYYELPQAKDRNLKDAKQALSSVLKSVGRRGRRVVGEGYSASASVILHIAHDSPGVMCGAVVVSNPTRGPTQGMYGPYETVGNIGINLRGNAISFQSYNDPFAPVPEAETFSRRAGIRLVVDDNLWGHHPSSQQLLDTAQKVVSHVQTVAANCKI